VQKLSIVHDDSPDINPREYGSDLATMACWHGRYKLGDVQPKEEPSEWIDESLEDGDIFLNLYLYDHSGISISSSEFGCGWDSGRVGFLLMKKECVVNEFGGDKSKALAYLEASVKEYDMFLRGNVWGYVVHDVCECCEQKTEVSDSCFGFLGDDLEYTGIADSLPPELLPQLEEAWERRFG
jgi:hypothetical protein